MEKPSRHVQLVPNVIATAAPRGQLDISNRKDIDRPMASIVEAKKQMPTAMAKTTKNIVNSVNNYCMQNCKRSIPINTKYARPAKTYSMPPLKTTSGTIPITTP